MGVGKPGMRDAIQHKNFADKRPVNKRPTLIVIEIERKAYC